MSDESQRLDKWLWHTRFFKSRAIASKLCAGSKVRVNRSVVAKAHYQVRAGDILTFPQARAIRVIRVLGFPERRGPASEARTFYEDLDEEAGSAPPSDA